MTTTGERWLPVPGMERHYEVSDLGRVRRTAAGPHTAPGRIVRAIGSARGTQVNLTRTARHASGLRATVAMRVLVHRLVWVAFVGPLDEATDVIPRNGDRTDARLCNLVTRSRSDRVRAGWAARARAGAA